MLAYDAPRNSSSGVTAEGVSGDECQVKRGECRESGDEWWVTSTPKTGCRVSGFSPVSGVEGREFLKISIFSVITCWNVTRDKGFVE